MKGVMDNLDRVRPVLTRVAKVQRRIWLLQAAFWPVVTLVGIVAAGAVGVLAWRRHRATAAAATGASAISQTETRPPGSPLN
jgi:hypothetical protein